MKLLVATRSRHKMREIRRILSVVPDLEVLSPDEAGLEPLPEEDHLEPHPTFEENARSKARYFQVRSGLTAVADDSGIEVDALAGAPGVHSKRFAPVPWGTSDDARDEANNRHLCVVVLDDGSGEPVTLRGEAPGRVADEPAGSGGFGYDPLFELPELGRTFAEITAEEKNARSHRGAAFRKLAELLEERRRR
jgi:XTP/dITP diphosphohydrolase